MDVLGLPPDNPWHHATSFDLHRGVAQIRAGATEVAPELLPHLGPAGPKKDIRKSIRKSHWGNLMENPETSRKLEFHQHKNDDFIRGK